MMLKSDSGRPDLAPTNIGPQSIIPMHADENWRSKIWYEAPREDHEWPEVYTYTDAISYAPGQTVAFHGSTTAPSWGSIGAATRPL